MTAGDIVASRCWSGVANRKNARAGRGAVCARGAAAAQMPTIRTSSRAASGRDRIARALALGPKLIVGDEPVSALDVSIQPRSSTSCQNLQGAAASYLFISHNLAVVEHISHHIAVMYLGRIVEHADTRSIFTRASIPSEALLSPFRCGSGHPARSGCCRATCRARKPPSGLHFHTAALRHPALSR